MESICACSARSRSRASATQILRSAARACCSCRSRTALSATRRALASVRSAALAKAPPPQPQTRPRRNWREHTIAQSAHLQQNRARPSPACADLLLVPMSGPRFPHLSAIRRLREVAPERADRPPRRSRRRKDPHRDHPSTAVEKQLPSVARTQALSFPSPCGGRAEDKEED